jgi:hypothetical protein
LVLLVAAGLRAIVNSRPPVDFAQCRKSSVPCLSPLTLKSQ